MPSNYDSATVRAQFNHSPVHAELGTALHRIVEAMDALRSTASSHQRSFVIEVMGRHCGYLAVMASLATAANWVLIPENPPGPDWPEKMCHDIRAGREGGRRQSVVVVAEGAHDIDVFVGGVIPRQDYEMLYEAGVKGIYGPGTPIPASAKDVLEQIRKAIA